jgi:hypothetical protein
MAGLSRYLALALFNMSLNPVRAPYAPPAGLWLALHTAAPSDSSYGFEATFGAYVRQEVNSLTSVTAAETAGGNVDIQVTNGSAIVFPASTGPQAQTITHWAIWDSAGAGEGNILYSGTLSASRLIAVGDSVVIPEGNISIVIK